MTKARVLVTAATGKIGGAVAAQLLEKGMATRALVHRDDVRSARLRQLGAEAPRLVRSAPAASPARRSPVFG